MVEEILLLYFDSKNAIKKDQNDSNLPEDNSKLLAETITLKKEIQFKEVITVFKRT
jgi:hypothetical protein